LALQNLKIDEPILQFASAYHGDTTSSILVRRMRLQMNRLHFLKIKLISLQRQSRDPTYLPLNPSINTRALREPLNKSKNSIKRRPNSLIPKHPDFVE